LLVWLIRALQRKPGGIGVLDTHAGAGAYDLGAAPALRTGEWREGIARLRADPSPVLADYLNLVEQIGLYPGSPALVRAMLRPQDQLVCCELHPEEYTALRARFAGDAQVAVHRRDAWEALGALLPPATRRGLVLIDPPYEARDEFDRLFAGLQRAHRRFANGVLVAWYPIKHRAPVRALHARLGESGMRDIVAAELLLREPLDPARLNGCGLIVVNPPYRFAEEVPPILDALLERLGSREAGEAASLTRLAAE
jgi:23S rRNA (adenine2030-N6)-methyltransferase